MNYSAPCRFCGQIQTFEADSGTGYKATVKLTQKGTIKLAVKKEARWEIES